MPVIGNFSFQKGAIWRLWQQLSVEKFSRYMTFSSLRLTADKRIHEIRTWCEGRHTCTSSHPYRCTILRLILGYLDVSKSTENRSFGNLFSDVIYGNSLFFFSRIPFGDLLSCWDNNEDQCCEKFAIFMVSSGNSSLYFITVSVVFDLPNPLDAIIWFPFNN